MSWNYRVMAIETILPNKEKHILLQIADVYYDKLGNPKTYGDVKTHTEGVYGDDIKEIKSTLKLMSQAIKKPILWSGDKFPKVYKPKKQR